MKRASSSAPGPRWQRWLGWLALALLAYGVFDYATLPDVGEVVSKNPARSALMEQRTQEAAGDGRKLKPRQSWVGLSAISPSAVDAVLLSEDARFYQHDGVDTEELRRAMAQAWRKKRLGRGASTITQQVVKNLWLSGERSLWRKAKEIVLARRLERAAPKKRILTLYLNIAEWGDGVYGIEAAAREHFKVSAAALSPAQGIVLASMLPAPRRWSVTKRSPALRARSFGLLERVRDAGKLSSMQAYEARAELEALFGMEPGESVADDEGDDW